MDERIKRVIKHPATIPATVGVISFGGGIVTGILISRKTVNSWVREQLEAETHIHECSPIQEVVVHEFPEVPDVQEAMLEELIVDEELSHTVEITVNEESSEAVRRLVFAGNDDEWDYDEEVKGRTEDAPYVIHRDEFYDTETGYKQSTLCYYAGDDIMCDEEDVPLYAYTRITGPLKFGHGSGDENVFYVRNDERHAEYEVLRHTGLYSHEVLGLEIERFGSDNKEPIRKFREE